MLDLPENDINGQGLPRTYDARNIIIIKNCSCIDWAFNIFKLSALSALALSQNKAHFLKYRGGSRLEEKFPGNSSKLGIISSVYWEISPPGALLPNTLGNLLFSGKCTSSVITGIQLLLERGKQPDRPSSDYTWSFSCHPWKQRRATCSAHKKQRNGAKQILNCPRVRKRYW